MGFAGGFQTGYSVVESSKKKNREEQEREAIRAVIDAKPVTSVIKEAGFQGMTGTLDEQDMPTTSKTTTQFMGKTIDGNATDQQINTIRNQGIVDAIKASDPTRAFQIERQFKQDEREDKRFEREDRKLKKEDDYEAERANAFKTSRLGSQQAEYQKAVTDYQKKLADYEAEKAAGKSGPQLGLPPPTPAKPKYELGDRLSDMASMFEVDAKFGKVDMQKLSQFGETLDKLRNEGYGQALKLAQSGAPIQEVAKAFNANGEGKFDPASLVSDEIVQGKNQPATRLIKYKDEQGNVRTINTLSELDALDKADKVFTRFFADKQNQRADEQLQLSKNADSRASANASEARAERADAKTKEKERTQAAVDIFKERNPGASEAQIRAVRSGILKAVEGDKNEYDFKGDQYGSTGTRINKATGQVDVIDTKTGQIKSSIPAGGQQKPKDIYSDPRALEIKNNSKLSVDEKRKKLMELGY